MKKREPQTKIKRTTARGGLSGKVIAVTRPREQAQKLIEALEEEGAEVIPLPLISVCADRDPAVSEEVFTELGSYEWIVFTSRNGVHYFFEEFFRRFEDIRSLGILRIAVVGTATADALKRFFLKADLIPDSFDAVSLVNKMDETLSLENTKILVVTGSRNHPYLVEKLNEANAIVDTYQVYRTDLVDLKKVEEAKLFRSRPVDVLTFTSGSTVESFVKQAQHLQPLDSGRPRPYTLSIGPVTSEALKKAGIPVDMEAKEATYSQMVGTLISFFKSSL